VIDSLQLRKYKVATPVNWKQGDDVVIAGSVSDEVAKKIYPRGWKRRGLAYSLCRGRVEVGFSRICFHSVP
jgi:hypothetical protein